MKARASSYLSIFLPCQLLVLLLGAVDYLTGDYSLVIFYLIPVSTAAWFGGIVWGGLTAVLCGIARVVSDYLLHGREVTSPLHYWNYSVELFFFLIVVCLVFALQRALTRRD